MYITSHQQTSISVITYSTTTMFAILTNLAICNRHACEFNQNIDLDWRPMLLLLPANCKPQLEHRHCKFNPQLGTHAVK